MANYLVLRITFINLIILHNSLPCIGISNDEECQMNDSKKTPGKCKVLSECQFALGNLQSGILPTPCNGKGTTDKICCPDKQRISTARCELYKNVLRNSEPFVKKKNKKKLIIAGGKVDENASEVKCETFVVPNISGGRDTGLREYPHQVALGYGAENITWRCGGTLISPLFVLTAGHCVKADSKSGLPVKVLLGDRRLSKQEDPNRIITDVLEIIPHPDYKPPILYNDLALIKLKTRVILSRAVLPACLPEPEERLDKKTRLEVTGWGQLGAVESQSDILQSVTLNRFGIKDCSGYFTGDPSLKIRLPLGIIRSQFCAGDKKGIKDSCRGDSGGPVVVTKDDPCVFYVIGITSFGSNYCGYQQPGVYTTVQRYLDWIEDIVWSPENLEAETGTKPVPSKPWTDFMFPYIKSTSFPNHTDRTTQKQGLLLFGDSRKTEPPTTSKTTIITSTTVTPSSTSLPLPKVSTSLPLPKVSTSSSLFLSGQNSWAVERNNPISKQTSFLNITIGTTNVPISGVPTSTTLKINTVGNSSFSETSEVIPTTSANVNKAPTSLPTGSNYQSEVTSPYQNVVDQISTQIDSPLSQINKETNEILSGIYDSTSTNISDLLSAIKYV